MAVQKTEIVVLTTSKMDMIVPIQEGNETIQTKAAVRHLGIMLDTKLTYWEQIRRATEKGDAATTNLSRLMANVDGQKPSKRRVLISVVHSILLYDAEIWADALNMEKYRQRMASVQRKGALRVTCSLPHGVSESATLVVGRIIPIDLLARERKFVFTRKAEVDKATAKREARIYTRARWKEGWDNNTKGRWTARLINQLDAWLERDHGEVNYYLTQLLTDRHFRAYLHRMEKNKWRRMSILRT